MTCQNTCNLAVLQVMTLNKPNLFYIFYIFWSYSADTVWEDQKQDAQTKIKDWKNGSDIKASQREGSYSEWWNLNRLFFYFWQTSSNMLTFSTWTSTSQQGT